MARRRETYAAPHINNVDSVSEVRNDALWYSYPSEARGRVIARVIPAQSYMTGDGIHELKRYAASALGVRSTEVVWQLNIQRNTIGNRDGFLFRAWER